MTDYEEKTYPLILQVKSEELGQISGHASTFVVDRVGDKVLPGAFQPSITDSKGIIPMLLGHDLSRWVGMTTALQEDHKGLKFEGQLYLNTVDGRETFERVKANAAMGTHVGISIGYIPKDTDMEGTTRLLKSVELVEISVTPFPAGIRTRVEGHKSIRNMEQELRDATNCSLAEARKVMAWLVKHGLTFPLVGNQPEPPRDVESIRSLITSEQMRLIMQGSKPYGG